MKPFDIRPLPFLVSMGAMFFLTTFPVWCSSPGEVGPRTEEVSLGDYAKVLYVSASQGEAQGPGTREKPYRSLADALAGLSEAEEEGRTAVLVASGTYAGETLILREGVDLFGGFAPGDWQRDIEHRSVLDGEGRRRVVIAADDCRLDGFDIVRGRTDGFGAGVFCEGVSPTLSNNRFLDNQTQRPADFNLEHDIHQEGNGGGAVACFGGSPSIRNNRFENNRTEVGNGGGILCLSHSKARIEANLFTGNTTGVKDEETRSSNGGAVGISHFSSPRLLNNVIVENHAGGRGDAGGIYVEHQSDPVIESNLILRNTSDDDGGAVYVMKGSHPRLLFNSIVGNCQEGKGGSTVRISKVGSAYLDGNTIIGNEAAAIVVIDGWLNAFNDVLAFNKQFAIRAGQGNLMCTNETVCDQEGEGISLENGTIYLTNSIVSGNKGTGLSLQTGNAILFNCLVEGGTLMHHNAGGEIPINGETPGMRRGRNNFEGNPDFIDDSVTARGTAGNFSVDSHSTEFILEEDSGASEAWTQAVGRPVRVGGVWSVVAGVAGGNIRIWGNLSKSPAASGKSVDLFVPITYSLGPDSPCIDAGQSLGAPTHNLQNLERPLHRLTEGKVDVGADEFQPR
jgi:hypothetical protein